MSFAKYFPLPLVVQVYQMPNRVEVYFHSKFVFQFSSIKGYLSEEDVMLTKIILKGLIK